MRALAVQELAYPSLSAHDLDKDLQVLYQKKIFGSTLRTDFLIILYHQVIVKCGVQGDIYDLGSQQCLEVLFKTYPIAISLQLHFP